MIYFSAALVVATLIVCSTAERIAKLKYIKPDNTSEITQEQIEEEIEQQKRTADSTDEIDMADLVGNILSDEFDVEDN